LQVGGRIKSLLADMLGFNSNYTITCMEDIFELLRHQTAIQVSTFSREDIEAVATTLPSKLSPLKGALKMHMVLAEANGRIRSKQLPTDTAFQTVTLTANFRTGPNRQVQASLATYQEESEGEGGD
jgi:hypothetical protein